MSKKLTILVTTTPGWGHINACAGAVSKFPASGHRVIFVIEEAFRGKLSALGFEEFIYKNIIKFETQTTESKQEEAGDAFAAGLAKSNAFGPESSMQKLKNGTKYLDGEQRLNTIREMDLGMREAIGRFKPDLIFYESNALLPAIHYSGIPWIKCYSSAPQFYLVDDSLPPGGSGYPTNGDRSKWPEFQTIRHGQFYGNILNDYIESWGYERFPEDNRSPESQAFTVYAYPEEINYEAVRAKNWFNFEVFNKNEFVQVMKLEELLPESFQKDYLDGQYSGKLIYVSMGSLASIDLELMKRLVAVLGRTNHKYIFSKGPRHAEFELARNQWGDRWLAQTKIVPLVDLVITHGGNNSVTETFAHGKPMIVLPNFVDQFDNAQRLHETGFGIRLDTYRFSDQELVQAVDKLLYNEKLNQDLKAASERIQATERHTEFVRRIEQMFL